MLYAIFRISGALALIFLLLTFLSGILKWKMRSHKMLAFITIITAFIHGIIYIIIK